MGDVIQVSFGGTIDVARVMESNRQLDPGLIAPASEEVEMNVVEEHASDPIKRIEDIERISEYLVTNGRYRDNMLFIVGINFGLRASDLRQLRFAHLIDENFQFRKTFPILEKKTSNTRKVRKNRYLTVNDAVVDAVVLYLQHNSCKLDDYMFRSESNRGKNVNRPMSRMSMERVLKDVASKVGIDAHVATHTLRKTFGYHQMMMSYNDPRKLLILQQIFGHSTTMQTMVYIGLTKEEIEGAYLDLNLGGKECYAKFSRIGETA